ncbi:MAG: serine/threonine-protein kinase [Acidobacteriota bacterium]
MSARSSIPFVVGQWVRGERFYGRSQQLEEILDGPRNCLWLLGTRRVGKTSVLKQLEHLTARDPGRGYFPLFWDFQGTDDPQELHLEFADTLLDAEERLEALDIPLEEVEADDLFVSLGRLRRRLRARGLTLLLLCDEVEELIRLNKKAPALLRKLRRAMQSREGVRSVLASSIRLWALAEPSADTSPFLHGFTPPLYIETLKDDEARALVRQSQLPAERRPDFDDTTVELIRQRCANHPYLIQLVGKRCLELGDVEEACSEVATDRMVSYFFAIDFEMLSDADRTVIHRIAEQRSSSSASLHQRLPLESGSVGDSLHRLEHLGFIRRDPERRFALANYFFRRWLAELSGSHPAPRSPASPGVPAASAPDADRTLIRGESDQDQPDQDLPTMVQPSRLGALDNRFELQQQLGVGATGIVYRAYDRLLGVILAVKVLRDEYADNAEALERFRQEIVLSRDIGHPNVLRVYHLGQSDGRTFITMQLAEGQTLARLLAVEGPLAEARALALAAQMAAALTAAHAQQVLHRDIKPQNILVETGDRVLLTDFGLARVIGHPGVTRGDMFLGTPYYTSPEQASLESLDGRSDLYALGLVLYEMAVGRRPFEAETTHEVLELQRHAPAPDPRELQPELSQAFAALVLRCLEKDPALRFADAAECGRELGRLAAERGADATLWTEDAP